MYVRAEIKVAQVHQLQQLVHALTVLLTHTRQIVLPTVLITPRVVHRKVVPQDLQVHQLQQLVHAMTVLLEHTRQMVLPTALVILK